jgi:hypothetical protein
MQGKSTSERQIVEETLLEQSILSHDHIDFPFDPQKACLKLGPLDIFIQKLGNIPPDGKRYAVVVSVGGFGEGFYERYLTPTKADVIYHRVCEEVGKGNYQLELRDHKVKLKLPGDQEILF